MTPRYWVDTNIVLDHLLNRPPHPQEARDLIELGYQRKAEILVTPATVATVLYTLQKKKSSKKPGPALNKVRHALLMLLQVVEVIPMSKADFAWSANSAFFDLEDGAQYSAAMGSGRLDGLVTNNAADFHNVSPPLMNAAQALNAFKAHTGRARYVGKRHRRKN